MNSFRETFVGRQRELFELRMGLGEALLGKGRLFLMSGEPGVGKACLVEKIVGEAANRGVELLGMDRGEKDDRAAFGPWLARIRDCMAELGPEQLAAELGASARVL